MGGAPPKASSARVPQRIGPPVTTKTQLPPIPATLADVALVDGPTCAAAGGMSISQWLDLVRTGDAPQPVIRRPRFTRWRLSDVRAWLIDRAERGGDDEAAARVMAQATRASRAAGAKLHQA